ncbi:hypothetical protein QBC39DRAFT_343142 [Podospora conica]|nr:hypothetical protein QBC39DRAFT_343142 [Schizothecium conicum]
MTNRKLSRGLLFAAAGLLAVPFAASPILLLAGNFQVGNPHKTDAKLIGLEALSIVNFDGIILSNTTDRDYLVKFSYFPNAFTWSWPSAPGRSPTSGILKSGPTWKLDPFDLIETIPGNARDGGLPDIPADEYRCLRSNFYPPVIDMQCDNSFWTGVQRNRPFRFKVYVAWLPVLLHVGAAAMIAWVWACEWMMAKKKGWMRCQCPEFMQGIPGVCPMPVGTARDMEKLGEHDWNKVRAWLYWTAALYCLLPVIHGSVMGSLFLRALRGFDDDLPHGMSVNGRYGTAYLGLVGGSFAAAVVAALCVTARMYFGKPAKTWIDQQEAGHASGGEGYEGYRGAGEGMVPQKVEGIYTPRAYEGYGGGGEADRLAPQEPRGVYGEVNGGGERDRLTQRY